MARIDGAAVYHVFAYLLAKDLELVEAQGFDVFGRIYVFENGH